MEQGRLTSIVADPRRWARLNVGPRKDPQVEKPRPTVTWLDVVKMAGDALKSDTSAMDAPGGMMAAAADPGALRPTDTLPMPDAATFGANFIPGAGDVKGMIEDAPAVYEAGRKAWDDPSLGNIAGAGGMAALAGLGALPFVPGGMTKAVGKAGDALRAADDAPGFRAYHGSPHDFDRFDISKIGTGEGAQAYGHGLYFAEAEDTARSYRNQLAKIDSGDMNANVWDLVNNYGVSEPDLEKTVRDMLKFASNDQQKKQAADMLKAIKSGSWKDYSPPGRMYEVNIRANPDDFLDWDKPIYRQSAKVQKALGFMPEDAEKLRGLQSQYDDALYAALQGDAAAEVEAERLLNEMKPFAKMERTGSQFLTSGSVFDSAGDYDRVAPLVREGIPGIKYLDQGSRAAGEGSRNFVVFDDAIIDILRKYGLAGLLGGAGAFGAAAIPTSQAEASEAR